MKHLVVFALVACGGTPAAPVHNAKPRPTLVRFTPKLKGEKRVRFDRLAADLPSPCGRAHSLVTSLEADPSCLRTPHALRYLERLLSYDAPDEEVRKIYDGRYRFPKVVSIDLSHAPVVGDAEASVKLVEFFDFECPHCADFAPMLRAVEAKFGHRIGVFYKNFPLLRHHPAARGAAIAAVAAQQQGKFIEMSELIFKHQAYVSPIDLESYAAKLGLDLERFRRDVAAPETAAIVDADIAEADALKLDHVPTLFVNGRLYDGVMNELEVTDVVEEELEIAP